MKFHQNEQPPENKQKWLGDIYAEASQYAKEHEESVAEIAVVQRRLESFEPTLNEVFMLTRQWSIDRFQEIFKELGVEHQAVFYEKDLKDAGKKMVQELLDKGIAKVGERGAIIIDLTEYNLDVALLQKADGSGLYLTSDLPLSKEKFNQFDVAESIYITGQEQNFYFKQLFKVLELMGFHKKMTHIGYGLVNRPEGKMSSRLGNVVLYDDLKRDIFELLEKQSQERHPDWSDEKVSRIALALTMAVIKFSMQQHEAAKTITFDAQEAVSFEGFSAPYILYSIARIASLFKKAPSAVHNAPVDYALLTEPVEKKLVMQLARFPGVVEKALDAYNPSVITTYCFELAQAFNDLYAQQAILTASEEALAAARLTLAGSVKTVLENALSVLTISPVEEM
jgi:arginyl-tRNA synthetase